MIGIANGKVLTPIERLEPGVVVVNGERIHAVGPPEEVRLPPGVERIDASGCYVAPGLIDLHTHGLGGHDVMGHGLADAIHHYPEYGVTSFLATTLTAPPDETIEALGTMASILDEPPAGATCLGIHLEGPFLSRTYPGIAPPEYFQRCTWEAFAKLQEAADGYISMVTLAPEVADPFSVLARLRQSGVVVSVGHSNATYSRMAEAVTHGLDQASHTFNAMRPFHHREPGVVGAVLHFDDVHAHVIADGVHVHPVSLQLLLRAKGWERVLLISDSAPVAGLPEGSYRWRETHVSIHGDRSELEDGTLAGSAFLLDHGLRFLWETVGLAAEEAVRLATLVPARALQLTSKGQLAAGLDADIVLLDEVLRPTLAMVAGEVIWTRPS